MASNVITLPYVTADIVYSHVHGRLYALVDAMEPEYGNRLIEIDVGNGQVLRSVFVGSQPNMVRLTPDEQYAWITFRSIPFIRRVELAGFRVDSSIFLGPSKRAYQPGHRRSTIEAYNFTILPDGSGLALGLKTPSEFDFEALSLYRNGAFQPDRVEEREVTEPPFCLEPVHGGHYIVGHYQSTGRSIFSSFRVKPDGLELIREFDSLQPGQWQRNWIRVHNDTLGIGNGTLLDATDVTNITVAGTCVNDVIGDKYGFVYSGLHNAWVYPNLTGKSVYLTFYDPHSFARFDSVYLFEYPFYEIMLITELEVIDTNRFAVLIGKDYGQFTVRIVEPYPYGQEERWAGRLKLYPNPASDRVYLEGLPGEMQIRLYDILGRPAATFTAGGSSAEFDTGGLPEGFYLARFSDPTGADCGVTRKILIRR